MKSEISLFNDVGLVIHGNSAGGRRAGSPRRPNDPYRRLCASLGTVPVLTGVRKPRSKALVEQAVGTAQRKAFANDRVILGGDDAIAICSANGRVRARDINGLREMLRAESDRLNDMPYSGQAHSRRAWFNAHERALLRPLPEEMPDWLSGKPRTVRADGYVEFDGNLYYLGRARSGMMVVPRRSGDLAMVTFLRFEDGREVDTYKVDCSVHPHARRHKNRKYMSSGERRASLSREEIEAEAPALGAASGVFLEYARMSFSRDLYPESAARRDCTSMLSMLRGLGEGQRALAACYIGAALKGRDCSDGNTLRCSLARFLERAAEAGVAAPPPPAPAGGGGRGEDSGLSYPDGFFSAKLGALLGQDSGTGGEGK